jgi:hypothetical protein
MSRYDMPNPKLKAVREKTNHVKILYEFGCGVLRNFFVKHVDDHVNPPPAYSKPASHTYT